MIKHWEPEARRIVELIDRLIYAYKHFTIAVTVPIREELVEAVRTTLDSVADYEPFPD